MECDVVGLVGLMVDIVRIDDPSHIIRPRRNVPGKLALQGDHCPGVHRKSNADLPEIVIRLADPRVHGRIKVHTNRIRVPFPHRFDRRANNKRLPRPACNKVRRRNTTVVNPSVTEVQFTLSAKSLAWNRAHHKQRNDSNSLHDSPPFPKLHRPQGPAVRWTLEDPIVVHSP